MKKRIGIIGSLCCLGIVICVGIFDTQRKKGNEETIAESVQEIIDEEASTGEVPTDEVPTEEASTDGDPTIEAPTDETPADEAVAEDPEEEVSPLEDSEELTDENEYVNFAIANVDHYVNVRSLPSTTGEIVGKIYDGAVAEIVAVAGEQDEWFQITSGNVEGYIKAEFFLYGEAATEVMDQYVTRFAQVKADRLNVRAGQSTEEACIGHLDQGEKVKLIEDCGEWLHVQYTERKDGYVAAEYVTVLEEYTYAKTLEEEQAQIAAEKEQEEQAKIAVAGEQETQTEIAAEGEQETQEENTAEQEQEKQAEPDTKAEQETVAEQTTEVISAANTSNEELRKEIVNYAMQYVGNKYVSGGSSLASGTDCSGFTCFIYADFGYSISRTPKGQYSGAGRSIDYSEIQPGDIICYSSNGGKSCTHVALYIGDGQIVHAANSRKGVIVGEADYSPIIGVKNVID